MSASGQANGDTRRMTLRLSVSNGAEPYREIEVEVDYANDPRVVYWRQERNGMWMRVAVIAKLFNCGDKILSY